MSKITPEGILNSEVFPRSRFDKLITKINTSKNSIFTIHDITLNINEMKVICEALLSNPKITNLFFQRVNCCSETAKILANFIAHSTGLKELNISAFHVHDADITKDDEGKIITKKIKLDKHIPAQGNDSQNKNLINLAEALVKNKSIGKFNYNHSSITTAIVKNFVNKLIAGNKILEFDLHTNNDTVDTNKVKLFYKYYDNAMQPSVIKAIANIYNPPSQESLKTQLGNFKVSDASLDNIIKNYNLNFLNSCLPSNSKLNIFQYLTSLFQNKQVEQLLPNPSKELLNLKNFYFKYFDDYVKQNYADKNSVSKEECSKDSLFKDIHHELGLDIAQEILGYMHFNNHESLPSQNNVGESGKAEEIDSSPVLPAPSSWM